MIKIEILTDATIEGLQAAIEPWTHNGWQLHEGIVITAWKDTRTIDSQGRPMIEAKACGFLQILTRAEGTCKAPQAQSKSA